MDEVVNRLTGKDSFATSRLEKWIAKLYILFLPIGLFSLLGFLKDIFSVVVNYSAVIFHVLGIFVWLLNENFIFKIYDRNNKNLFKKAALLIVYLNISSIVMSCVIQLVYGDYAGESAFSGILGVLIYFFQFLLMFLYNIRVFTVLTKSEIKRMLHILCTSLLVIGYIQVAVMNGVGGAIYDGLDIFGVLQDSSNMPKLPLTGTEGASAGSLIGILIAPFLLSEILSGEPKRSVIELILWLVPLYFTYSTTAYILFSIDIVAFAILFLRDSTVSAKWTYFLVAIIAVLLILTILFVVGALNPDIVDEIRYLLFEKVSDRDNGSTVSRTVPFITSWGAFTEFPLFGVGNGLQGYFYIKYFPDWAFDVAGSDVLIFYERCKYTISNGGVFIPSLLSGYGIVGCVAIAVFMNRCLRLNRLRKEQNGSFYYMYLLGLIGFAVSGLQGDLFGVYYAWFVLSLPFIAYRNEKEYRYGA